MSDLKLSPDSDLPPTSTPESIQDEPDETFGERIYGLSEMIPKSIKCLGRCLVSTYQTICEASYVFFTLLIVAFGPVVLENELQRNQAASGIKEVGPSVNDNISFSSNSNQNSQ